MALERYRQMRDFERTPEPSGEPAPGDEAGEGMRFVVQKHDATRLHYDFRLELDGVLKSWAVPKGPSLDPAVKRLAMPTEDHPLAYREFEGVIPESEYGGGTVMVWDRGRWTPEGDPHRDLERGRLTFSLDGEKLHGRFHLVRTGGQNGERARPSWLLMKSKDDAAEADVDVTEAAPRSVVSGRSLEEIAAAKDRVWHSDGGGELPGTVELTLPTLVAEAPAGDAWIHEAKHDGYRLLARLDGGQVRLFTRRGQDWTHRYPTVAAALSQLGLDGAFVDGEVVVLDQRGVSRFQDLQSSAADPVYFAFDLLFADGRDLRGLPLVERKAALQQILEAGLPPKVARVVRYSDHVVGRGPAFFAKACAAGLEGIVSKRASSPYGGRRTRAWVKVKCQKRQEVVIGGFSAPKGSRSLVGALLVGFFDDEGALHYAGKVGTGFSEATLTRLHERFEPLARPRPPFVDAPRGAGARGVTWLEPTLVAEVAYNEVTRDGKLRQTSFLGLRDDKPASEVRLERTARPLSSSSASPSGAAAGYPPLPRVQLPSTVRLTHPKKPLFVPPGITKEELAHHYARVATRMLPHVAGRPLTLLRCPHGHERPCFFQKHWNEQLPSSILAVEMKERAGDNVTALYTAVESLDGLLALTQLGVLEVHIQGARRDRPESPDRMVVDLDPDEGLPWARVVDAATRVRDKLETLHLQSFVLVTGGKGLHVVVPLVRRSDFDEVKEVSGRLAKALVRERPSELVATMSKAKRAGKVFLDYFRNSRGASAIAPWSTRAAPEAPVAVPLSWEELGPRPPEGVTLRTLGARLQEDAPDPWEGYFEVKQSITRDVRAALGLRP